MQYLLRWRQYRDPAQRTASQIEWEYATVIERNSPLVQSLA